jgi:AcrR family transcriptional regulator
MADRDDWVRAAFEVLRTQSVDQVRVEALARQLGVTKGSFYWHFDDRPALLAAVLNTWNQWATSAIIARVEAKASGAKGRLEALFALIHGTQGAAGMETSIRAWAANDAGARKAVKAVDARRERFVAGLLREAKLPGPLARERSHLLYLALIGEFTSVAAGGSATPLASWRALVAMMAHP